MQPDEKKNISSEETHKELLCTEQALRGPEYFANLAEWVASPDYAVIAEAARKAAAERKRLASSARSKRYYAGRKTGRLTRIKDILNAVFSVPTVPLLPAPGQVVRWPAETIYSPIKAKTTTPYRYRPEHKRPQWQIDAERVIIATPRSFGAVVQALGMTAEECATYLRVTVESVRAWESGDEAIPFTAYWLLHVTYKSQIFRTRFPQWDGWEIQESGPDAGKLIDANRSAAFTPQEIACIPFAWHQASFHANRAERLEAALDAAAAENTRLRQLFNEQGVTAELRQVQERLAVMLDKIGTAEVIEYRLANRKLEKAA